jgi:hypothetical protein
MQLINPTLKIGCEHCSPANQYLEVSEELQQFSLACVFTMAGQLPQRRLTYIEMAQGVGMLQAGSFQCQVARALNVSQSVISRMLIRYQTTGTVSRRHWVAELASPLSGKTDSSWCMLAGTHSGPVYSYKTTSSSPTGRLFRLKPCG